MSPAVPGVREGVASPCSCSLTQPQSPVPDGWEPPASYKVNVLVLIFNICHKPWVDDGILSLEKEREGVGEVPEKLDLL